MANEGCQNSKEHCWLLVLTLSASHRFSQAIISFLAKRCWDLSYCCQTSFFFFNLFTFIYRKFLDKCSQSLTCYLSFSRCDFIPYHK